MNVPDSLTGTSVLAMHDRSDTVIPWAGGEAGGWSYESGEKVYGEWAKVHGCEEASPVAVETPYDGGNKNLACSWYGKCDSGRTVMTCLYDGGHGSWPRQGEELAVWFFQDKWKYI
jgi:poly(3-hydroxybutyrate) depolymerase